MAHRSFKGISAAARLSSANSDSDTNCGGRRRRVAAGAGAVTATELEHLSHPRAGPAPPAPARRDPPDRPAAMRRLLDRLATSLAPAPDDDKVVAAAPAVTVREVLRRFWPLARSYRKPFFAGVALAALLPAVEAAEIWIFKLIVDDVLVAESLGPLAVYVPAMLGLAVVGALLSFGDEYAATWVGERFTLALRTRLLSTSSASSPTRSTAAATATCWPGSPATCTRSRRCCCPPSPSSCRRGATAVLRRGAAPAVLEARARVAGRRPGLLLRRTALRPASRGAPRASGGAAAAR